MDERGNKRDLVLAPSEYAYMQDVTKGVIKTYTGPTVINPTAQERPVLFNSASKRFEPCGLEEAVHIAAIAPEGFYLVLKNPSVKGDHPPPGGVLPSPDLDVGRKINITGPCDFALWPGQIVKLVQGHHLRSNQYLLVRVYNEDEARRNWAKAVIKPAATDVAQPPVEATAATTATAVQTLAPVPQDLTVGKLLIIKGTDVSFYIPPTGVGVVPDEGGLYVRSALTLERLEYCILVDQNGKKRYERGPQVVFPEPTETFIARDGERKFRAIELNEIQGLHIKVIAPYVEDGRTYREGDELFITGKETAIYFPREEHSLVRYDGKVKHFAVAVPAGEARYVMRRTTGAIEMARGPAMLLPNPVDQVIVRRVLTDRECTTWYPGNQEALEYNRSLRQLATTTDAGARAGVVPEGAWERSRNEPAGPPQDARAREKAKAKSEAPASDGRAELAKGGPGDAIDRVSTYNQPRTIVFGSKFEGVPSVNVYVGYAVMVVDKKGNRRVEQGPINILLGYDESFEIIQLSTGTPKTSDKLLQTVYLRVLNNKVGDVCEVETRDHVRVTLRYSLRINFTGDPTKWFEVENYVKFICDHVRSVLKGAAKKHTIESFYASSVELVRDIVLGPRAATTDDRDDGRPGMLFTENGAHVSDIEVLDVSILDERIEALLADAQHEAVQNNITLLRSHQALEITKQQESIARAEADAKAETVRKRAEIEIDAVATRLRTVLAIVASEVDEHEKRKVASEARNALLDSDHRAELARKREAAELEQALARAEQDLALERLRAEAQTIIERFTAAQGGFSESLLALSSRETLVKVAEAMSVQSFVGGKTLVDVVDKVFAGTPLESAFAKLRAHADPGSNGG